MGDAAPLLLTFTWLVRSSPTPHPRLQYCGHMYWVPTIVFLVVANAPIGNKKKDPKKEDPKKEDPKTK